MIMLFIHICYLYVNVKIQFGLVYYCIQEQFELLCVCVCVCSECAIPKKSKNRNLGNKFPDFYF